MIPSYLHEANKSIILFKDYEIIKIKSEENLLRQNLNSSLKFGIEIITLWNQKQGIIKNTNLFQTRDIIGQIMQLYSNKLYNNAL